MTQDEIIEMARQVGFEEHQAKFDTRFEAFAKLVAAKEREKLKNVAFFDRWYQELDAAVLAEREAWKEIAENQRLRLQALNEIIGGENSTTTGNILSYSRWEMRLEDAVKEEREACAKVCAEDKNQAMDWMGTAYVGKHYADLIRARGEA